MPDAAPRPPAPAPHRLRRALPWWLGTAAPALVPSLVAFALWRVPGFDLLDYHACLALSPVVGLAAAHLAIARAGWPAWLLTLAGPLLVLLVHSWWVPNCAPWTGVVFYGLGPATSLIVGACLGAIAAGLHPRRARRLAWLIALCSVAPCAAHFLRHPQVFAYHGLVGWIGGAIYEDALAPHATYAWFRLADTAAWLAAAALIMGAARSSGEEAVGLGGVVRYSAQHPTGRAAACVLVAGLGVGMWLGPVLGWRVHGQDIERRLNARIELRLRGRTTAQVGAEAATSSNARDADQPRAPRRPDVVVHVAPRAGWRRRAQLIAEDLAVRWLELAAHFGAAPTRPIHVYLYPDIARKQRWMGAARVEMAKPWLRQVHMVWPGWGRSVTRHELAHVFAGVDAPAPFAVPLRHGFWPDALLIEGMAVAAEWPIRRGLDPHQWSAAMRRLGLAPPMERLLAPAGFFGESSARAYTLAGSLLRWVRDTHGPDALRRAYRDGDLAAATGEPLAELLVAWASFVDRQRLRPQDLARARARFERSGLFYRPCSLEIGRCRERARRAWRADDSATALREWATLRTRIAAHAKQRSLGLDIELSYAYALGQNGQLTEADAVLAAQLRAPRRLTALQRARMQLMRGELAIAADDPRQDDLADAAWRAAATAPLSAGAHRMLTVKRHLLTQGDAGQRFVRSVLNDYGQGEPFNVALQRARRALPSDAVVGYLWARRRTLGRGAASAAAELRALRPRLASWPRLQREVDRLLAQHAARTGACGDIAALAARAGAQRAEVVGWRDALTRRCAAMRRLTGRSWMALVGPRT